MKLILNNSNKFYKSNEYFKIKFNFLIFSSVIFLKFKDLMIIRDKTDLSGMGCFS